MNEDEIDRQLIGSKLLIALAAILISLPLVIGAGYDLIYPRAAYVNDKQLPSYETYSTNLYKDLSERDLFSLTEGEEDKMRALYAAAERDHLEAVSKQAVRSLLMYGALMTAGLVLLVGNFRFRRR
jgi:hypothetical protein